MDGEKRSGGGHDFLLTKRTAGSLPAARATAGLVGGLLIYVEAVVIDAAQQELDQP